MTRRAYKTRKILKLYLINLKNKTNFYRKIFTKTYGIF